MRILTWAEPAARDAASAAIHNVMSWSGMLPGTSLIDVSKITPAHLNLDNLHRELSYPVVRKRGIVDLVVPAGAAFLKGDLLANVRSIDGCLLEELRADFDGHVLCWSPGVVRMEGDTLGLERPLSSTLQRFRHAVRCSQGGLHIIHIAAVC